MKEALFLSTKPTLFYAFQTELHPNVIIMFLSCSHNLFHSGTKNLYCAGLPRSQNIIGVRV